MSVIMSVLSPLFWGLLVLSLLVFIHEGGHFLAARAFGVRVTEFFLGMPSRLRLSFKSKRMGTEFGVTPILLGGYNRICGMDPGEDELLGAALAFVQEKGRVTVSELAEALSCEPVRAAAMLALLSDWAAVHAVYDPEKGDYPNQSVWPETFETQARDASGLTSYDAGHDPAIDGDEPPSQPGATAAGEPHPVADAAAFLDAERSRTYRGLGLLKRIAILLAGPLTNILAAYLIVTGALCLVGIDRVVDINVLGGIVEDSYAQAAGLETGDEIVSIAGYPTQSWIDITEALDDVLAAGEDFDVEVVRDGQRLVIPVDLPGTGPVPAFGVYATVERGRLSFLEASSVALSYAAEVGKFAVKLIIPTSTMEVLDQSSSVVGMSVMVSEAASVGLFDLLLVAGAISMSLGFMNLLPIPPLDGGKILIELIQAVSGRELSAKVQNAIGYVGLAFFLFIFAMALKNDIVNIFFGG